MYYLIPIFSLLAIGFGIWLVYHTLQTAWNESIKSDPNHDNPWRED